MIQLKSQDWNDLVLTKTELKGYKQDLKKLNFENRYVIWDTIMDTMPSFLVVKMTFDKNMALTEDVNGIYYYIGPILSFLIIGIMLFARHKMNKAEDNYYKFKLKEAASDGGNAKEEEDFNKMTSLELAFAASDRGIKSFKHNIDDHFVRYNLFLTMFQLAFLTEALILNMKIESTIVTMSVLVTGYVLNAFFTVKGMYGSDNKMIDYR